MPPLYSPLLSCPFPVFFLKSLSWLLCCQETLQHKADQPDCRERRVNQPDQDTGEEAVMDRWKES